MRGLFVCLFCLGVSEIFRSMVPANSAEVSLLLGSLFAAKWESVSTKCHPSENKKNKTQESKLQGGGVKFLECDLDGVAFVPLL